MKGLFLTLKIEFNELLKAKAFFLFLILGYVIPFIINQNNISISFLISIFLMFFYISDSINREIKNGQFTFYLNYGIKIFSLYISKLLISFLVCSIPFIISCILSHSFNTKTILFFCLSLITCYSIILCSALNFHNINFINNFLSGLLLSLLFYICNHTKEKLVLTIIILSVCILLSIIFSYITYKSKRFRIYI